jgi:hypothetical protein
LKPKLACNLLQGCVPQRPVPLGQRITCYAGHYRAQTFMEALFTEDQQLVEPVEPIEIRESEVLINAHDQEAEGKIGNEKLESRK